MSGEQREMIAKAWSLSWVWITRVLLAANIFFLTEVYRDFKEVKKDVAITKGDVSTLKAQVDILTNFDLKSRK